MRGVDCLHGQTLAIGCRWDCLSRAEPVRGTHKAIFKEDDDYAAFEQALEEAGGRCPMRVLVYCFLAVCRYVERSPLRARLVACAEEWAWSSLSRRRRVRGPDWLTPLSSWPVEPSRSWTAFVNRAETDAELAALRRSVQRGAPYGEASWQRRTAVRLKLESSLRDPWRPRKVKKESK